MIKRERRVKLARNKQRELMLKVAKKCGSLKKFAKNNNIPYSTVKGYSLVACFLPENLFDKILKLLSIDKKNINAKYLDWNWGFKLGGEKGMASLERKYPEKINYWKMKGIKKTIREGTHYGIRNFKKIRKPLLDERLSEFIGVFLGDGTMTKYFIKISGDCRYDLPYFLYLKNLIYDLFNLDSDIRKDKREDINTLYLTVYSKGLSSFLENKFGIKPGNKLRNNTLIPDKILNNKKFSLACLRGLVDTDGSVSRRGRRGEQFTVVFTSHNKNMVKQVKSISDKNNLFTFLSQDGRHIGTNSYNNILRYFKIVGSSNLRHIVRFYSRFYENKTLYQREVKNYYQESFYKDIKLPYKINID